MAKISVIIPVYNVENTLKRCLDSFLAQSFKDFELLLIDDGSIDGTGTICETYSLKDQRVRVIHTFNKGVSQARELGIREATGVYSIHADGDDWVEPEMLKDMYEEAVATNADIVISDYYYVKDKVEHCVQKPSSVNTKNIICDILTGKMFGSTWNKLVRHQLYECYGIHFPKDVNYCEDSLTIIRLLLHIRSVTYLPKAYYHYMYNPFSITQLVSRKTFEERKNYINCLKQILNDVYFEKAVQENILRMKIDAYYSKLFTSRELENMYPENRKYIMQSSCCLNLKILMLLVSWGMYHLAVFLERKILHV